jgi:hypothetical protein
VSRLVVAALMLLLTVGALFGAAAWNRGGETQAIELTERELELPWAGWRYESPGPEPPLRLRLRWQRRDEPDDARVWLTDVKLRELGFGTGVPPGAPEAEGFYGRSLPRVGWVAFEFDGPAWRQIEQRLLLKPVGVEPARASRLVPIDAAPTADVLLRRYASAPVVVLRAVIGMRYRTDALRGPSVWGVVERLVTEDVSVPLALRAPVRPLRTDDPAPFTRETPPPEPRYHVRLRVGRLGALWIESLTRTD